MTKATDYDAGRISERLRQRDPLSWYGVAANARAEGIPLAAYIRRRIARKELERSGHAGAAPLGAHAQPAGDLDWTLG